MNKIDKLLNKINNFCSQALTSFLLVKKGAEPMQYHMPDDPDEDLTPEVGGEDVGKYNELLHVAQQVDDPGLASELTLLAELYRKAIEIGGGYSSINKSIHSLINMYLEDEDNPQQEAVEDILNEVVSDLRARAGGGSGLSKPDSPEAVKQLKTIKDNYNTQSLHNEVESLSNYEESASGTFDPTGGVSKEEGGKGFGKGYSVSSRKSLKDWEESFRQEKARYTDMLATVPNTTIKEKIQKLLEVLSGLINNAIKEQKLKINLQDNDDPEIEKEIEKVKEDSKKLRAERGALKLNIRNYDLSHTVNELNNSLSGARDERTQERIRQEIALNNLLKSLDIGKREEVYLRKLLIKSMSGGNWPSPETKSKIEEKIREASSKKKSITQYRIEEAVKTKDIKQSGSLGGLIIHLQQKLASMKKDAVISIKSRAKKDITFDVYKKAVQIAKENFDKDQSINNKMALQTAINNETEALQNYLNNHPIINEIKNDLEVLYSFRDKLKMMNERKWIGETISEEVKPAIHQTVIDGEKMISDFQIKYRGIVKTLQEIVQLLKSKLEAGNG